MSFPREYPVYPEFGKDTSLFTHPFVVTYEQDLFTTGTTINFQFKTASSDIRLYDMRLEFLNGEVSFKVLEDVTCTDGVTVVTPIQADRNNTFVTSVFASTDPSALAGGTVLDSFEHFGLNTPISGFMDATPNNIELITLKRNSNYIFKFENISAEDIVDFRFLLVYLE